MSKTPYDWNVINPQKKKSAATKLIKFIFSVILLK